MYLRIACISGYSNKIPQNFFTVLYACSPDGGTISLSQPTGFPITGYPVSSKSTLCRCIQHFRFLYRTKTGGNHNRGIQRYSNIRRERVCMVCRNSGSSRKNFKPAITAYSTELAILFGYTSLFAPQKARFDDTDGFGVIAPFSQA